MQSVRLSPHAPTHPRTHHICISGPFRSTTSGWKVQSNRFFTPKSNPTLPRSLFFFLVSSSTPTDLCRGLVHKKKMTTTAADFSFAHAAESLSRSCFSVSVSVITNFILNSWSSQLVIDWYNQFKYSHYRYTRILSFFILMNPWNRLFGCRISVKYSVDGQIRDFGACLLLNCIS